MMFVIEVIVNLEGMFGSKEERGSEVRRNNSSLVSLRGRGVILKHLLLLPCFF